MLDVGKVVAIHQEQKKQIEDSVQFNRQTSSILIQSCLNSRQRDRKLLEELLRDNQNLREGRVMPALRAFDSSRKKMNMTTMARETTLKHTMVISGRIK